MILLVFMRVLLYNKDMDTNNYKPIFNDEQLNKMSKENLTEVILLMQKQQSKLEKISGLQKKQQVLEEKNKELEFINALLSDRLSIAQRKRFGSSSEKYADGYEQMNLFNEAENIADIEAEEPVMEEICPKPYKRKKRKGKKEQDLSAYPITETIHYTLNGEDGFCPECGTAMKEVTTEITKTLKFVPAHFEVLEEVVHVYSCPKCSAMERAQKPQPFLKGSIATPSLVAGIMNAKYVNGMPLARQEREFKRYDLNISAKTMANWIILCAQRFLEPLYNKMKDVFLQSHYAHCDETRIQVLDEPEQKSETQNWMWVYMLDGNSDGPKMVLFQYERTRGGYHPKEFLDGYSGYLTTDGYQSYHNLPEQIRVTGCMAHSRRRFEECLTILKKQLTKEQLKQTIAYQAMERIAMLYKIEELMKNEPPEKKYEVRQTQAKPLVDAYFAWLHTFEEDVDRSSKIGEAILYALNQEKYLRRYLEDGHLSIDNNECERSIKNFAIGRRNWLFAKSIKGATASAIVYSITETAILHGLRPYDYLAYVMEKISQAPQFGDDSYLNDLLPWSPALPDNLKSNIIKQ